MGHMVRHDLAARSLRHLRFAHRMMASQPLLARASHMYQPPTAVSLDGYLLPMGHILRRLPLNDSTWSGARAESGVSAAPAADTAPPAETLLRLLPRLPEMRAADTTSADPEVDVGAPISATTLSGQTHARRVVDNAPPALTTPATTTPLVRADGLRPRSRIVELPGTVSLPTEEPIAEEPSASDTLEEPPEEAPVNAHVESVADDQVTAGGDPAQPLLLREERKGAEEPATVSPVSAPMAATEEAPPTPPAEPAPTPRRRSKHTPATPPRASDVLFPPTDADRSPAAWLARLQHTEKPASPARPESPDSLVKPGNEPPPSTPVQRPGTRSIRKGATSPQASKAPAPPTHTASATTPSPERSSPEEQPALLPGSSRTLLHTLTGVDPASVRIYRGPVAERATSAQNADALTDDGAIVLGGGRTTDTPETLGLLAHELTHIAQRRSPRFVPPVSQTSHHQERFDAGTSAPVPQDVQLAGSPADEEALATQVEARVTDVARARATPPNALQPALLVESAATAPPAGKLASRLATRSVWGDLPAPWEPLPDWMTTPTDSSVSAPQSASQPQPSSSAAARAPSVDTPGTQRAERGRSLPAETEESSPAHIQEAGNPEPDLDQLAQQVHAILKRRLAAERRRFG